MWHPQPGTADGQADRPLAAVIDRDAPELHPSLSALPMDICAQGQAVPLQHNVTPAGRYPAGGSITLLRVEQAS